MADCPICSKPAAGKFKPFCSKRCADIDLYRWLKGGYAIPGGSPGPQTTPQAPEGDGEKDPEPGGA